MAPVKIADLAPVHKDHAKIAHVRPEVAARSGGDARDVVDELIDRYGDVPSSVMGLIDIALVRNRAAAMGVYEIRQNDSALLLYLSDIRRREVPELIGRMPGRAMLSAGGKPYIAVRMGKTDKVPKILKTLFVDP